MSISGKSMLLMKLSSQISRIFCVANLTLNLSRLMGFTKIWNKWSSIHVTCSSHSTFKSCIKHYICLLNYQTQVDKCSSKCCIDCYFNDNYRTIAMEDYYFYYLPRRRRPGTGDIATPPVRPSVCPSVRPSVCLSIHHV